MKRGLAFLTLLALLAVPVSAMAAAAGEFELSGFVKLETWWDSVAIDKELSGNLQRSNALQPQNMGRFNMTTQYSRIGLKVTGPEVLGAKTKGYIEFDFNSVKDSVQSSSNSFVPRLRHAFLEMEWPGGWKLLMGQYWDFFDDFEPEVINDSPYQNHGDPSSHRVPQARLTYKTGPWTFAGMACTPYNTNGDNVTSAFGNSTIFGQTVQGLPGSGATALYGTAAVAYLGERTCMPQFQGQIIFEKDLYGKAGYKDKPKPFTFEVEAAVQRTQYLGGQLNGAQTFGQGNYQAIGATPLVQGNTQTLTPWIVQGTLFIPVLVTHSPQLANTAAIIIQGQIGQGFSLVGNGNDSDNSFFKYNSPGFVGVPGFNTPAGNHASGVNYTQVLDYQRYLTPKYGGFISGTYYFTNEWHATVTYGFDKAFGVNTQDRNFALNPTGSTTGRGSLDSLNTQSYTYASLNDMANYDGELQADLFFTPNKNLKFGIGYSWLRTSYFQQVTIARVQSRAGNNQSVRFGAWFYF